MKGKYHIIIQNNRVHYEFDLRRNITIIRGDSGSGKTTLINMIDLLTSRGTSSGIEISCSKNCRTLPAADWQIILPLLHDQIIFLDEDSVFIKSEDFARAVRQSDNYFVIVTREDLPNLPYSVDEIYGIHASGKYHDLKRTYNELYRIYEPSKNIDQTTQTAPPVYSESNHHPASGAVSVGMIPDAVVTEDSHSGFTFFDHVCRQNHIQCQSAGGKSSLRKELAATQGNVILGIADGAAIGPEMNELYQLMVKKENIRLYLPESFEWLILRSGLIDGKYVQDILEHPEDFIDSTEYFSWEQFFTSLLEEQTQNTYLQYQKSRLNPVYLQRKILKQILDLLPVRFSE